jgi:YidC/Oxa1 family membrane protein insertase
VPAAAGGAPGRLGAPPAGPRPPPPPRRPRASASTIRTDTVKATFDSVGGTLVRLELLGYRDHVDRHRNVVLFDQTPSACTWRQTGLITLAARGEPAEPPDADDGAAGRAQLAAGTNELTLRSRAESANGVKLAKTYHLQARQLHHRRQARGHQRLGRAADAAAVPAAGARRQPAGRRVVVLLHLHRPGDVHRRHQVPEARVQGHREGQGRPPQAGRQRLGGDGAALLRLGLAAADKTPREFRTAKVTDNHYTVAMVQPLGEVAAGAHEDARGDAVLGPAGRVQARRPGAGAGTGEGLRLADRSCPSRCSGCWTSCTAIGNWGWAIVALVVLLKIAFYWLNASAYKSMAKMKAINPKVMELRERHKDNRRRCSRR